MMALWAHPTEVLRSSLMGVLKRQRPDEGVWAYQTDGLEPLTPTLSQGGEGGGM